VPFPRGSLTQADLAKVLVLNSNGVEIPAFVEQLTPWRHVTNAVLNETSVRVARIQIHYSFSVQYPNSETISVSWGGNSRTQNVAALENPRNGWSPVTSGSFVSGDGVSEPKVYALLPNHVLTKGVLKFGPMDPFSAEVNETRDDPNTMDATEHYANFLEQDYASKNFFYAHIGQDDPAVTAANQIPYKAAEGEPWLYDRVTAFYVLYFRSGFFKALRESVRAAEYYRTQLYPEGTTPNSAVGVFRLKAPNPDEYIGANGVMYSYPEGLAYTHWITGDDLAKAGAKATAKAHEDVTDEEERWSVNTGYTERHMAFRVIAHVIAFELFGNQVYKNGATKTYRERVMALTDNLIWHQNGADGILPSNRVDGGLWRYGRQEGNGPDNEFVVSFWQTPFILEAMLRAYAITDSTDIANFIRRSGTAMKAATKIYTPDERDVYNEVNENLRLVDYVTLSDGSQYADDGAFSQHALQMSAALCWSYYFSRVTNQTDITFKQWAQDLYRTYDYDVNEWTRPAAPASGLTAYRNSPPRMYNWQYKPSGSLSWCMGN
jgi:hypothetical protein